jgi:hypothetical protein
LDEAYAWLQAEFEKIEGTVRKVSNPHDFGEYPSFEIDYPEDIELVDTDDDDEDEALVERKDDWHDKANAIEAEYSKKFGEWL